MSGPGHRSEPDAEIEAVREGTTPAAVVAETQAARVVELQRTIGNRAVRTLVARAPQQVKTYQEDGPYGLAGAFEVEFDGIECKLKIKAKIVPGAGVTPAEAEQVMKDTREAFERFWDGKFILTDTKSGSDYFL